METVRRMRLETAGARRALLTAALILMAAVATAGGRAQSGQLVVRVTDTGFTPSSAAAEPGLVHLSLENGGSAEVVRIRVGREGEGGGVLREIEVSRRGGAVSTELDAAPGVYTLTEAERGWVFRLTVGGVASSPTPTPESE